MTKPRSWATGPDAHSVPHVDLPCVDSCVCALAALQLIWAAPVRSSLCRAACSVSFPVHTCLCRSCWGCFVEAFTRFLSIIHIRLYKIPLFHCSTGLLIGGGGLFSRVACAAWLRLRGLSLCVVRVVCVTMASMCLRSRDVSVFVLYIHPCSRGVSSW